MSIAEAMKHKMKTSRQRAQAQGLKHLFRLVMRHESTRGKGKRVLQAKISAANDRFYARWQRDGLAMLVLQNAKWANGKAK